MKNHSEDFYNNFYKDGGWNYDYKFEESFIKRQLIDKINIQNGASVLDLGCGVGFHSNILHQMGFKVIGMDSSEHAITIARENYPNIDFHCFDAANLRSILEPESLDLIFCRGMSWYHYELLSINRFSIDVPLSTKNLFGLLKATQYFFLQISTDFSGTEQDSGVLNNKVEDYQSLFSRFGNIVSITDWRNNQVDSPSLYKDLKYGISLIVQKS
ncbi:class I SAM-dependent methyltransferase [Pedobacter sp. SAFR-022]|uniref:class I SAM-dependent methyltransferase n=1 Tax=Pedobacter sp. SAFR-022 TaxID=3436861 RepID=UPI003F7EA284